MEDLSSAFARGIETEVLSDEVEGVANDSVEEDKGIEDFLVTVFPRCKTPETERSDVSS